MKKNNKKKLPRYWLGTRKPTSIGYLPNKGIGDATATIKLGQDMTSEARAAEANYLPHVFNKLLQNLTYPLLALLTASKVPIFAPGIVAASSSAPAGTGVVTNLAGEEVANIAPELATTGTKQALSVGGKVLGGLGAAYSAFNIGQDIANAGDIMSLSEIARTSPITTYTTEYGNTYKQHGGVDRNSIMRYASAEKRAKLTGLALDAMGFGAGVGSIAGGWLGAGIGTVGGLLIGGLADLFGFGDNDEEYEEMINRQNDVFAMQDKQSEALAKNKDVKTAFYSGEASAADGKRPVWTPSGLINKKATARVSNGELIGNFRDGTVTRVAGKKNNKDTKLAALDSDDFVISNKFGLSDYAAATGDYEGALNMLDILMKNYKNGKMPRYWLGKNSGDYILTALPRLAEMALVGKNINTDKTADVSTYDPYVDDAESRKAVNILASQKYNERPYLYDATKAYNMANWAARRMTGAGLGGRMMLERMNFADYLNNLAKVHTTKNEMDVKNSQVYANALAALGAKNQQARIQSNINKYNWLQQAYGARFNALRSDRAQLGSLIAAGAKDLYGVSKDQSANAYRDRMELMYNRQLDNDDRKILIDAENAAANRLLAAIMYGGHSTAQDGLSDMPWWYKNYRLGQAARAYQNSLTRGA